MKALFFLITLLLGIANSFAKKPTPPELWKDYDPDKGEFKEEIISEKTEAGIYYRETYISAYVNDAEIRVYCKYAVKKGAKNAPGLMDVHGWMGVPRTDMSYVNDGWAVMAHDYCGKSGSRPHYTKYPESLQHGNMDAKVGFRVKSKTPDGKQITDPRQSDDYLWYAIQRRVLSYLLAQKEVDATRIGAKGFSYGGTLMWNLGMDSRVKATVAYFGIGWIEYYRNKRVWMHNLPYIEPKKTAGEELYLSAIAPQAHAPHITAASLWLNCSNDHHGGHERAGQTFKMFKPNVPWDFAVQARGHHNTEKLGDDCKLWLERHVLGKDHFWPSRPKSEIKLGTDGIPELHLTPANPGRIKELTAYQCLKTANNIERYWRDVKAVKKGNTWIAKLPVMNVKDYVFSYANIRYDDDCVVSSDFEAVIPSTLGNAIATDKKSSALPGGADRWSDVAPAEGIGGISGFRPIKNHRGTNNNQFSDPKWKAPLGANLKFKFYCTQPQDLLITVTGGHEKEMKITASDKWQTMTIKASEMINSHGQKLSDWSVVGNIGFKPMPEKKADITKVIFADFEWKVVKVKKLEPVVHGKTYLSKEMASYSKSFHKVENNKGFEGEVISVGGKKYERGLGLHADSKMTFPLNSKYSSFHVVPGPDDAHKGIIEMKILVDGKEVFSSGKVSSSGYKAKALNIPVSNAKTLTLIVTDGGNGKGGDHASWADAYLTAR